MGIKTYLLYCEICGYKRITDGSDATDLVEIKTSPLITGAPKLDPITKKMFVSKTKPQRKRFKCPKCGRVVFPRQINKILPVLDTELDEESNPIGDQGGDEGQSLSEESST